MTNDDYKRGYREGYQDGVEYARELYGSLLPIAPVLPTVVPNRCNVCGITFEGAMGYVCTNPRCPTRVVFKGSTIE